MVSADRLAAELWADDPPARSSTSLQAYVSRLRKVLEPERAPRQPARVLVSRDPGYALAVDADNVDVARFARLAREGAQSVAAAPAQALARLDAALGLWRGEPFPELGDTPTAVAERARLLELRTSVVEDRFDALLALGREPDVLYDVGPALDEHPYRERLWGQMMLALYRSRRPADALAAFQRARRRLADDLGLDPGPELRQLELDILADAPRLTQGTRPGRADAGRAHVDHRAHSGGPIVESPTTATDFVGRTDVLAELDDGLRALAGGTGRVVVVTGEAGIGKSAVLQELRRTAGDTGALVASAAAIETDLPPAFQVWSDLLRDLLVAAPGEWSRTAFVEHGNIPAVLDPALADRLDLPVPALPADAELSRTWIYRGVIDGLRSLAGRAPLVLTVDDAQWLDPASSALLRLLAEELADVPILLVAAHRPEPRATELVRLQSDRRTTLIRLGGLDRDELGQLAARVGQVQLGADAVDTLVRRTAGNPLFVAELVRVVSQQHGSFDAAAFADIVPDSVQPVIGQRMDGLPGDVADLLGVAGAFDAEFDLGVLAEVSGLSGDELYDRLDTAVVAGILVAGEQPATMRFSHDLFRAVATSRLGPLRLARVHLAIADHLGPTTDPLTIARHLRAATAVAGAERVADALRVAALWANGRRDYDQAKQLLREALDLTARAPVSAGRLALETATRTALGLLHQEVDGYLSPMAAEQAEAVVPLLQAAEPEQADLSAWWFWLSFALADGTGPQALAIAESMLACTPQAESVVEAHRGLLASFRADLPGARRHLTRAADIAPGLPRLPIVDWDPMVGILAPLAVVVACDGDDAEALRLLARADDHVAAGDAFAAMYVAQYRAWVGYETGDADAVRRAAGTALELAERQGYPDYRLFCSRLLGWAEARLGEAAGIERILGVAGTPDRLVSPIQTGMFLADALLALGRSAEALAAADEALALEPTHRDRLAVSDLLTSRGRALARLGDRPGAVEALERAAALAHDEAHRSAERRARAAARALQVDGKSPSS